MRLLLPTAFITALIYSPVLAEPMLQYEINRYQQRTLVNYGDVSLTVTGGQLNFRDDCPLMPGTVERDGWAPAAWLLDPREAEQFVDDEAWTFDSLVIRPGEAVVVDQSSSPCARSGSEIVGVTVFTDKGDLKVQVFD